jgi:type IV fimbrial biogenesis protein FimT
MVTLTIAAVLLTIGAPSISRFIESNRLTTTTNEFIFTVNAGRAESVKRGVPAILCESSSGSSCNSAGTWNSANGWILFADIDSSGSWTANDAMIRIQQAIPTSLKITSTANNKITFNRLGTVDSGEDTYSVCNSKVGQKRDVALTKIGQTTLSTFNNVVCPL